MSQDNLSSAQIHAILFSSMSRDLSTETHWDLSMEEHEKLPGYLGNIYFSLSLWVNAYAHSTHKVHKHTHTRRSPSSCGIRNQVLFILLVISLILLSNASLFFLCIAFRACIPVLEISHSTSHHCQYQVGSNVDCLKQICAVTFLVSSACRSNCILLTSKLTNDRAAMLSSLSPLL